MKWILISVIVKAVVKKKPYQSIPFLFCQPIKIFFYFKQLADEVQKSEDEEEGLQSARRRTRERIRNAARQRIAEKSADEEDKTQDEDESRTAAESDRESTVVPLEDTADSDILDRTRPRVRTESKSTLLCFSNLLRVIV